MTQWIYKRHGQFRAMPFYNLSLMLQGDFSSEEELNVDFPNFQLPNLFEFTKVNYVSTNSRSDVYTFFREL